VIKKRWISLLFDKTGLPGGWLYGGGIYCAWFMINHNYREAPASSVLLFTILLPAFLLFFKAPFHAKQHGKTISPSTFLTFIMEWIVELLEVFSGYLSNTLSFMRVAGLGIAHVSLMVSFFTIADLARGPNPTALSSFIAVLLLITGNIMVILLEGLSAGIQALRLNYYEFFTKFFTGTGKPFQPVSLRNQSHL
jgi:V/A-type H+/Na+-transporting ATPase subunit I